MTNDELNEAIATAKGWVKKHGRMDFASRQDHDYWLIPDRRMMTLAPDNWAESIEDAWELFAEVSETNAIEVGSWGEQHLCRIFESGYPTIEIFSGQDATAPRAICLAWLEWKKAQP